MGSDPNDRDETIATVTKVMAQIVGTLRDEAATLSEGAAAQLLQHHAERTRPAAVRPLASLAAADHAGSATVRWRHGLLATVAISGERVIMRLPDRVMTFPASCADAVQALYQGQIANAGTVPGLDRTDATVLIRRLLREAVVVPVNV